MTLLIILGVVVVGVLVWAIVANKEVKVCVDETCPPAPVKKVKKVTKKSK